MVYIIRRNCEYSLRLIADSEDDTLSQAREASTEDWDEAWSGWEVEEE